MTKKEYNTINDAINNYEAALQQDTHDEPQKAKISQLLRVAQLAKTEQEAARQASQAKYVEGGEFFRAENWDDAIATFEMGRGSSKLHIAITRRAHLCQKSMSAACDQSYVEQLTMLVRLNRVSYSFRC